MAIRLHLRIAVAAFMVAVAPPLAADSLRSSIAVTSDYIHRGVSQTDGEPALQASIAYWHPTGWYGGLWASNIGTARRYFATRSTNTEVDAFAGYSRRLTPDWVVDVQAISYFYPDDDAPASYDYLEIGLNVAYKERYYASVMAAPEATIFGREGFARDRPTFNYELSMQQRLSSWATFTVGAGYHDLSRLFGTGYLFGSASVGVHLGRLMVEIGYYGTDRRGREVFGSHLAGGRTVVTATMSF